jgi:hypothetical protein
MSIAASMVNDTTREYLRFRDSLEADMWSDSTTVAQRASTLLQAINDEAWDVFAALDAVGTVAHTYWGRDGTNTFWRRRSDTLDIVITPTSICH